MTADIRAGRHAIDLLGVGIRSGLLKRRTEQSTAERIVKTAMAVLLLPVCIGSGRALWEVVGNSGRADTVWIGLLAGALCWCITYILLPKPMWVYVFGHELTHAVWTWLFGGKVRRFKVTAKGGHVVVTRSNFLVTLAPYFFPLYAVIVVLVFFTLDLLIDLRAQLVWFHLCLGAAYAFHVTLTWHVLQSRQSDISENGYLFSAVVIWLGNLAVLLVGVPLLTRQVRLMEVMSLCGSETVHVLQQVSSWIR